MTLTYQVRFFDRSGVQTHVRKLACDSEEEAVQLVADLPRYYAMQLWSGERMVQDFPLRDGWASERLG